jgi:response regulator NasT
VKPFRSAELLPKLASILNKPEPLNVESQESPVVDDKIETREIVQQAKEQLMAAKGLTESEAFELIQQSAMKTRRRMRDVAQEVIAGTYVE